MPEKERCGAKKRNGGSCTQWPVEGARRCRMHGGNTAKAAARAETARAMQALGDVPDQTVDPAEALMRLVTEKWAECQWLRQRVREVEAEALTWSTVQHDEGVGPEGPIDKRTARADAHVWWRLLREAEDQLAKYSTAALRAGVERRQIELQEAQALHLAQAIHRILDQLELSQEQAQQVPTIVPQVLRALPIGDAK